MPAAGSPKAATIRSPRSFREIDVDGFFLEYDTPRAGSFAPLAHLGKGKVAVLGLVTTKSPKLESKDELKRRIDEAAEYVPLEYLALSPQCGFASDDRGQPAHGRGREAKAAARRRDSARGLGFLGRSGRSFGRAISP